MKTFVEWIPGLSVLEENSHCRRAPLWSVFHTSCTASPEKCPSLQTSAGQRSTWRYLNASVQHVYGLLTWHEVLCFYSKLPTPANASNTQNDWTETCDLLLNIHINIHISAKSQHQLLLTYKPVHKGVKALVFWTLIWHILQNQGCSLWEHI